MEAYSDSSIITLAKELLKDNGMISSQECAGNRLRVRNLSSDGSTRRFWRISISDQPMCVVAAPLGVSANELYESKSAWFIGNHLHGKGCAVPELYGWHEESGLLLFEDLGDERLHSRVVEGKDGNKLGLEGVTSYYTDIVGQLAHMQINGVQGFQPDWCWDNPLYDKTTMLTRESDYFLKALWFDTLHEVAPEGISEEFNYIADIAAEASTEFFLHRDFQSRNIMIKDGGLKFIDFQGGRLGPLGYDLASLLIDPYCALSQDQQDELEEEYFNKISKAVEIKREDFTREYNSLALQRNLQILGAFAFLSKVRKKPFFAAYIKPALFSAKQRLQQPVFKELQVLPRMIDTASTSL